MRRLCVGLVQELLAGRMWRIEASEPNAHDGVGPAMLTAKEHGTLELRRNYPQNTDSGSYRK